MIDVHEAGVLGDAGPKDLVGPDGVAGGVAGLRLDALLLVATDEYCVGCHDYTNFHGVALRAVHRSTIV